MCPCTSYKYQNTQSTSKVGTFLVGEDILAVCVCQTTSALHFPVLPADFGSHVALNVKHKAAV